MRGVKIRDAWFPYNSGFYYEAVVPGPHKVAMIAEARRMVSLTTAGLARKGKIVHNLQQAANRRKHLGWHRRAQLAVAHQQTSCTQAEIDALMKGPLPANKVYVWDSEAKP